MEIYRYGCSGGICGRNVSSNLVEPIVRVALFALWKSLKLMLDLENLLTVWHLPRVRSRYLAEAA